MFAEPSAAVISKLPVSADHRESDLGNLENASAELCGSLRHTDTHVGNGEPYGTCL